MQHLLRKDAIHKLFIQRKKEDIDAKQRLTDAVKNTRLTAGVMFKVRHTRCDDEVLKIWRGIEQKKQHENTKTMMKHVNKYNTKLANYEDLVKKSKSVSNYNISGYKIWCNIRQKKIDGALPLTLKDWERMLRNWKTEDHYLWKNISLI